MKKVLLFLYYLIFLCSCGVSTATQSQVQQHPIEQFKRITESEESFAQKVNAMLGLIKSMDAHSERFKAMQRYDVLEQNIGNQLMMVDYFVQQFLSVDIEHILKGNQRIVDFLIESLSDTKKTIGSLPPSHKNQLDSLVLNIDARINDLTLFGQFYEENKNWQKFIADLMLYTNNKFVPTKEYEAMGAIFNLAVLTTASFIMTGGLPGAIMIMGPMQQLGGLAYSEYVPESIKKKISDSPNSPRRQMAKDIERADSLKTAILTGTYGITGLFWGNVQPVVLNLGLKNILSSFTDTVLDSYASSQSAVKIQDEIRKNICLLGGNQKEVPDQAKFLSSSQGKTITPYEIVALNIGQKIENGNVLYKDSLRRYLAASNLVSMTIFDLVKKAQIKTIEHMIRIYEGSNDSVQFLLSDTYALAKEVVEYMTLPKNAGYRDICDLYRTMYYVQAFYKTLAEKTSGKADFNIQSLLVSDVSLQFAQFLLDLLQNQPTALLDVLAEAQEKNLKKQIEDTQAKKEDASTLEKQLKHIKSSQEIKKSIYRFMERNSNPAVGIRVKEKDIQHILEKDRFEDEDRSQLSTFYDTVARLLDLFEGRTVSSKAIFYPDWDTKKEHLRKALEAARSKQDITSARDLFNVWQDVAVGVSNAQNVAESLESIQGLSATQQKNAVAEYVTQFEQSVTDRNWELASRKMQEINVILGVINPDELDQYKDSISRYAQAVMSYAQQFLQIKTRDISNLISGNFFDVTKSFIGASQHSLPHMIEETKNAFEIIQHAIEDSRIRAVSGYVDAINALYEAKKVLDAPLQGISEHFAKIPYGNITLEQYLIESKRSNQQVKTELKEFFDDPEKYRVVGKGYAPMIGVGQAIISLGFSAVFDAYSKKIEADRKLPKMKNDPEYVRAFLSNKGLNPENIEKNVIKDVLSSRTNPQAALYSKMKEKLEQRYPKGGALSEEVVNYLVNDPEVRSVAKDSFDRVMQKQAASILERSTPPISDSMLFMKLDTIAKIGFPYLSEKYKGSTADYGTVISKDVGRTAGKGTSTSYISPALKLAAFVSMPFVEAEIEGAVGEYGYLYYPIKILMDSFSLGYVQEQASTVAKLLTNSFYDYYSDYYTKNALSAIYAQESFQKAVTTLEAQMETSDPEYKKILARFVFASDVYLAGFLATTKMAEQRLIEKSYMTKDEIEPDFNIEEADENLNAFYQTTIQVLQAIPVDFKMSFDALRDLHTNSKKVHEAYQVPLYKLHLINAPDDIKSDILLLGYSTLYDIVKRDGMAQAIPLFLQEKLYDEMQNLRQQKIEDIKKLSEKGYEERRSWMVPWRTTQESELRDRIHNLVQSYKELSNVDSPHKDVSIQLQATLSRANAEQDEAARITILKEGLFEALPGLSKSEAVIQQKEERDAAQKQKDAQKKKEVQENVDNVIASLSSLIASAPMENIVENANVAFKYLEGVDGLLEEDQKERVKDIKKLVADVVGFHDAMLQVDRAITEKDSDTATALLEKLDSDFIYAHPELTKKYEKKLNVVNSQVYRLLQDKDKAAIQKEQETQRAIEEKQELQVEVQQEKQPEKQEDVAEIEAPQVDEKTVPQYEDPQKDIVPVEEVVAEQVLQKPTEEAPLPSTTETVSSWTKSLLPDKSVAAAQAKAFVAHHRELLEKIGTSQDQITGVDVKLSGEMGISAKGTTMAVLGVIVSLVTSWYVSSDQAEVATETERESGMLTETEKAATLVHYNALQSRSEQLSTEGTLPFPIQSNRIATIAKSDINKQIKIAQQAQSVRPIIHHESQELAKRFLFFKKQYGSEKEKELYASMSLEQFIDRLLKNRPLAFYGKGDAYLLRDGKISGKGGSEPNKFEAIGTDKEVEPLILKEYLSYDEIAVAALLGVSVPTFFINDGSRNNEGKKADEGTFQGHGVYTGLVGARFERPEQMEYKYMLITPEQNVPEKGYGIEAHTDKKRLLDLWASLYGVPYIPTYEEIARLPEKELSERYIETTSGYLHKNMYRKRMKLVLEPFFADAHDRALTAGTTAYCHMVGLGIGVWAVNEREQAKVIVEVVRDILHHGRYSAITDVDFSYFPDDLKQWFENEIQEKPVSGLQFYYSKRNPADKLEGQHADKLLVAAYAWDGGSYPGNEYWLNMLAASGDPAAASCSTISEIQNPLINDRVGGKYMQVYP